MKKRVTMFVWNDFTTDARVLRSCLALQEEGYQVLLVSLLGKQERIEKHVSGFEIISVSAEFKFYHVGIFLMLLILNWFIQPVIAISLMLVIFIIFKTKLRFLIRKLILILKMTYIGLQKKTDVYHANDLNTLPQAIFCAKLKRKKLIFDSHEVNTSRSGYNSKIFKVIEKRLIYFPDCVIHENKTRAMHFKRIYGFYPEVIYNYPVFQDVKASPLHHQLGLKETEPILLYQGGIQVGRGLDKLLEAVKEIRRGIVVFIGDGKLKSFLIQESERLGIQERVKFLPKVPLEELPKYTINAYLGFQLLNNTCFNHYSAASNKLFEYIMAGVPVIACSFPEIKKVILEEDVGILVESHNPKSIARGVNFLLDNPEYREYLSENALQARFHYTWELEKKKLLLIYIKLLEDKLS